MKFCENDFTKVYDNLSAINEDTSTQMAPNFWKAAKEGLIDTDEFHNTFDTELDDEIRNKLFDPTTGLLKNRGTWGIIKELDSALPSTKALKLFWQTQFSPKRYTTWGNERIFTVNEINKLEKEAADKKAKEDQERAAKLEIGNKILSLIDKDLHAKVMAELKAVKKSFSEFTFEDIAVKQSGNWVYIKVTPEYAYSVKTEGTAEEQAAVLNKKLADIYSELTFDFDIRKAKWWSRELMDNCRNFTLVFQHADGKVQKFEKPSTKDLVAANIPMDAELVGASCSKSESATYTFQNSSSDTWYSVSNNINEEATKALGVNLNPETVEQPSFWGESSYEEISKEQASGWTYFKTGMDRWFWDSYTNYGTD